MARQAVLHIGDINMSEKACFFIGHRSFMPKYDRVAAKNLRLLIAVLAESGVTDFYSGGSPGWGLFCERSVLMLKKHYPQLRLHLVLPCPPEKQSIDWDIENKLTYSVILDNADSIEIVSDDCTDESIKESNLRLAELGDVCICYLYNSRSRTATAQTVRMARKAKKSVINMCTVFRNT